MSQIINMFWVVVIFWLIIEIINSRITKNKKISKIIDEINDQK